MKHAAFCLILFFTTKSFSAQMDCSEAEIDSLLRSFVYLEDQQDEVIFKNKSLLYSMKYKKFPALYELYAKNKSDERYVHGVIVQFLQTDGDDIRSKGDEEALNITRQVLRERGDNFCLPGIIYLAKKGNASDVAFLHARLAVSDPSLQGWAQKMLYVLQTRVAGTNLIEGLRMDISVNDLSRTKPAFLPSVANTGPQAELVFQRIKEELTRVNGDVKKLPTELLTLTIPPPQPGVELFKGNRLLIGIGVLLLAGIGVLVFWKKRKR